MRNSDYWLLVVIINIPITGLTQVLISYLNYDIDLFIFYNFWWVTLLPPIISKRWFPNSRFTRWLEKNNSSTQ